MRSIVFVILLVCAISMPWDIREARVVKFTPDDAEDILVGFFEALGAEGEEIDEIIKCIKDLDDFKVEIVEIIADLKKIDIHHLQKLVEVLADLIQCLSKVMSDVVPCLESETELWKMIKQILALTKAEILFKLERNILFHGPQIYADVMGAVKYFDNGNYTGFGFNMGNIIVQILFNNPKVQIKFTPDDAEAILIGFFTALGAEGEEIDEIIKCIKDLDDFKVEIVEIIADIKKIDVHHLQKLVEILADLIQCLSKVMADVVPCLESETELWKMIKQILALSKAEILFKLERNILFHGPQIYADVMGAVKYFDNGNYTGFGYNIGNIIVQILFNNPKKELKFGPDDAYKFVKGLLTGLRFPNVDVLMKCIDNVPNIYNDILKLIQLLQHIDIKHITDIIKAIEEIFDIVSDIINAVKPCADVPDSEYIQYIITKMKNISIPDIALNIILHGGQLLRDLQDIVVSYQTSDFGKVGQDLGDFFYEVVLVS